MSLKSLLMFAMKTGSPSGDRTLLTMMYLPTVFKALDALFKGNTGLDDGTGLGGGVSTLFSSALGGNESAHGLLGILAEDGTSMAAHFFGFGRIADLVQGIGDLREGDFIDAGIRLFSAVSGFPGATKYLSRLMKLQQKHGLTHVGAKMMKDAGELSETTAKPMFAWFRRGAEQARNAAQSSSTLGALSQPILTGAGL